MEWPVALAEWPVWNGRSLSRSGRSLSLALLLCALRTECRYAQLADTTVAGLERGLDRVASLRPTGRAHARYALLLSGRIPSYGIPSSTAILHAKGASIALLKMAARSQLENIVLPNAESGGVDVFAHTWNPEAAALFDSEYGEHLVSSLHQPVEISSPRDKAYSHALSIGRGALLIRHFERTARSGEPYRLVLSVRVDLVVGAPVRLERFRPDKITLAAHCCFRKTESEAEKGLVNRTCRGRSHPKEGYSPFSRAFLTSCAVPRVLKRAPYTLSHPGFKRSYFVMDWWIAATSADLASWAEIGQEWDAYECMVGAMGFKFAWSHYVWPIHLHDAMEATDRIAFSNELLGSMARQAHPAAHAVGPRESTVSVGSCLSVRHLGRDLVAAELLASPFDAAREATILNVPLRYATMARMCPAMIASEARRQPIPCCEHHGACGDDSVPISCAAGLGARARFVRYSGNLSARSDEILERVLLQPRPPSAAHALGIAASREFEPVRARRRRYFAAEGCDVHTNRHAASGAAQAGQAG
jgi:hypothetical protein